MHNKYSTEFGEMYKRIVINHEEAYKTINEYEYIMKKENLGVMGMIYYLKEYVEKR